MADEVPLRDYIEALLKTRDERFNSYKEDQKDRLEHLNQLRERVITREEYNQTHGSLIVSIEASDKAMSDRIALLEKWQYQQAGKFSGVGLVWGIVVAIAGLALAIFFGLRK